MSYFFQFWSSSKKPAHYSIQPSLRDNEVPSYLNKEPDNEMTFFSKINFKQHRSKLSISKDIQADNNRLILVPDPPLPAPQNIYYPNTHGRSRSNSASTPISKKGSNLLSRSASTSSVKEIKKTKHSCDKSNLKESRDARSLAVEGTPVVNGPRVKKTHSKAAALMVSEPSSSSSSTSSSSIISAPSTAPTSAPSTGRVKKLAMTSVTNSQHASRSSLATHTESSSIDTIKEHKPKIGIKQPVSAESGVSSIPDTTVSSSHPIFTVKPYSSQTVASYQPIVSSTNSLNQVNTQNSKISECSMNQINHSNQAPPGASAKTHRRVQSTMPAHSAALQLRNTLSSSLTYVPRHPSNKYTYHHGHSKSYSYSNYQAPNGVGLGLVPPDPITSKVKTSYTYKPAHGPYTAISSSTLNPEELVPRSIADSFRCARDISSVSSLGASDDDEYYDRDSYQSNSNTNDSLSTRWNSSSEVSSCNLKNETLNSKDSNGNSAKVSDGLNSKFEISTYTNISCNNKDANSNSQIQSYNIPQIHTTFEDRPAYKLANLGRSVSLSSKPRYRASTKPQALQNATATKPRKSESKKAEFDFSSCLETKQKNLRDTTVRMVSVPSVTTSHHHFHQSAQATAAAETASIITSVSSIYDSPRPLSDPTFRTPESLPNLVPVSDIKKSKEYFPLAAHKHTSARTEPASHISRSVTQPQLSAYTSSSSNSSSSQLKHPNHHHRSVSTIDSAEGYINKYQQSGLLQYPDLSSPLETLAAQAIQQSKLMAKGHRTNNKSGTKNVSDSFADSSVNSSSGKKHKSKTEKKVPNEYQGIGEDEFPTLSSNGLYAFDVMGDGNCLFRALSDQYFGDGGKSHRKIRAMSVEYMSTHPQEFEMFMLDESFEQHLNRMKKDGTFGDQAEIVAFSRTGNCDILIHQRDTEPLLIRPDVEPGNGNDRPTLHIAYHYWEHYSSVRNVNGPYTGHPQIGLRLTSVAGDYNQGPEDKVMTKRAARKKAREDENIRLIVDSLPYNISENAVRNVLHDRFGGNLDTTLEYMLCNADEFDGTREEQAQEQEQEQEQTVRAEKMERKKKVRKAKLSSSRIASIPAPPLLNIEPVGQTVQAPVDLASPTRMSAISGDEHDSGRSIGSDGSHMPVSQKRLSIMSSDLEKPLPPLPMEAQAQGAQSHLDNRNKSSPHSEKHSIAVDSPELSNQQFSPIVHTPQQPSFQVPATAIPQPQQAQLHAEAPELYGISLMSQGSKPSKRTAHSAIPIPPLDQAQQTTIQVPPRSSSLNHFTNKRDLSKLANPTNITIDSVLDAQNIESTPIAVDSPIQPFEPVSVAHEVNGSQAVDATDTSKKKGKRVTAREKKEKQKMEAALRRRQRRMEQQQATESETLQNIHQVPNSGKNGNGNGNGNGDGSVRVLAV